LETIKIKICNHEKGKIKMMTLDHLKDEHIGKTGTAERDEYEMELKVEILGEMIKTVRKENQY